VCFVGRNKKFNAHPFPYRHELVMEIATLTNLGVGLGRVPLLSDQRSAISAQPDSSGSQPSAVGQFPLLIEGEARPPGGLIANVPPFNLPGGQVPPNRPATQPSALAPQNRDPATAGGACSADASRAASTPQRDNSQPTQPPNGWVVMVPFTLPGEKVRVRVFRNHKNYSEADLLEVLTPAPERVAAPCPLFGTCGGCQYQHLTYAGQLKWKRQQVEELLRHMAGIEFPVNPVIGSPKEFGYRSKITPHFAVRSPAKVSSSPFTVHGSETEGPPTENPKPKTENSTPIGFLKQGSRFEIVDVPQCPIATDAINAKLPEVRAKTYARLAAGEYKRDATLLLRHAQEGVITDYDAIIHELVQPAPRGVGAPRLPAEPDGDRRSAISSQPNGSGSELSALAPQNRDPATAGGANSADASRAASAPPRDNSQREATTPLRLHFLARDFFQNNPFILPAFTGYVRDQAAATGAKFLVDAYCGSGLFALSCAPAFARVAGIEISATSVKFATENAAANGIANATFRAGDAAQIFAGLEFPPADTAVVIDPPRRGCDESFLNQLFAFGPRAVVYVSCDPATQMRDLKSFLTAGYRLTAVQPFDLFPQTRHLECVITLAR